MGSKPIIFVVDDDDAVRDSLHWLIESVGLEARTFASAPEFLEAYNPAQPGCLLLDVRMPGMSGLELQERLAKKNAILPIIVVTAHGDVPMAVRAMKAGAVDFIEKPFNDQVLLERIHHALANDAEKRQQQAEHACALARLGFLSPREREILDLIAAGKPNKAIAAELGLSVKTIEFHRAKIMEKMRAESLSELVRMVILAGRS